MLDNNTNSAEFSLRDGLTATIIKNSFNSEIASETGRFFLLKRQIPPLNNGEMTIPIKKISEEQKRLIFQKGCCYPYK